MFSSKTAELKKGFLQGQWVLEVNSTLGISHVVDSLTFADLEKELTVGLTGFSVAVCSVGN